MPVRSRPAELRVASARRARARCNTHDANGPARRRGLRNDRGGTRLRWGSFRKERRTSPVFCSLAPRAPSPSSSACASVQPLFPSFCIFPALSSYPRARGVCVCAPVGGGRRESLSGLAAEVFVVMTTNPGNPAALLTRSSPLSPSLAATRISVCVFVFSAAILCLYIGNSLSLSLYSERNTLYLFLFLSLFPSSRANSRRSLPAASTRAFARPALSEGPPRARRRTYVRTYVYMYARLCRLPARFIHLPAACPRFLLLLLLMLQPPSPVWRGWRPRRVISPRAPVRKPRGLP